VVDAIRLADRAAAALRDEIRAGRLPPGSRLREEELSANLGLSRTPLREALRRLAEEGLVVIRPYCGATVADVDEAEVTQLLDVRIALELLAVRTLAPIITAHDLTDLRHQAERILAAARTGDRRREFIEDAAFHRLLAERAGNQVLAGLLARIDDRVQLVRLHRGLEATPDYTVLEGHRRLCEALAARDASEAARIMEEHLRAGWRTH
jgi:DNA-binding GntR family transcriptional regulator